MAHLNPEEISITQVASGVFDRKIAVTPIGLLPEIIQKSKRAQIIWAGKSIKERKKVLKEVAKKLYAHRQGLAKAIATYNGKPEFEALTSEIFPTLCNFDLFCKKAEKELSPESIFIASNPFASAKLIFQPLGVVGVISPWNFPFLLAMADVPAALLAGNAVVIKPSEFSAQVGFMIEDLFRDAEIPDGLVQVIQGYGNLGEALIGCGIHKICFTGSTATGKKVLKQAAAQMIPCALEMGGKDAAIILDDADLEQTVSGILWAGLSNCGQACASVEWVFFPATQETKVLTAFAKGLEAMQQNDVGVMNTPVQKAIVENQIKDALAKGAKIFARRHFGIEENPLRLEAQLLYEVSETSTLYAQENFGPVISFFPYENIREVKEKIKALPFGLTASIWTRDFNRTEGLIRDLEVGTVTINDHMVTAGIPEIPWLGAKDSGFGFSRSRYALRNFSKMKTVFLNPPFFKKRFWQFPYDQKSLAMGNQCLEAQFEPAFIKRWTSRIKLFWGLCFG